MNQHPREIEAILMAAHVAKGIIASRILTALGFIACAAIFGYALYAPTHERIVTASLFAVLVYWPLAWRERKEQAEQQSEVQQ